MNFFDRIGPMTIARIDPILRFWKYVDKTPGFGPWGDCWRWTGTPEASGYARFYLTHTTRNYVHRISYELHHGPIPPDLETRHKCGVRLCVNVAHLSVGTAKDNAADRDGHGKTVRGERYWSAKLTANDVKIIRSEFQTGKWSKKALARRFDVSATLIFQIVNRQSWRHVP